MDAAILRMLAKIRRKDPEIYKTDKAIFEGVPLGLFLLEKRLTSVDRGTAKIRATSIEAQDTEEQGHPQSVSCAAFSY